MMMRTALLLAVLAAVLCLDRSAGHAQTYGHAPWCAVVSTGAGAIERDCEYDSVEACAPNVIAGNRGSCEINPYYRGGPGPYPHHRRHIRHRHRYH